jgi:YHS domain-containing protein
VTYAQRAETARDDCCCGNVFVVGSNAHVGLRDGFRLESQAFTAPWGEHLQAMWLIGSSTHADATHDPEHHHHEEIDMDQHHAQGLPIAGMSTTGSALDPVCGMTVDPEAARAAGRHSQYKGVDYFFCSRGCKLDFDEEPERYLDPSYAPSM